MRICVFGAGAVGGFLGARLAHAGADVSLVARGPHVAAIRDRGLELRTPTETIRTRPRVTADAEELGPQDYVFVTLKAHDVPGAVPALRSLFGAETTVVMAVNGVPWWYFHGIGGPFTGTRLSSVDPQNVQWDGIGPERVLGCVVYPAVEVEEPGVVRLIDGDRFSLGEPDGSRSDRALRLAGALVDAGLRAPVRPRIRDELWVKLWGNLAFNPLSVLTCASLATMVDDPDIRAVARAMMVEAQAIAEKLGVTFPVGVDARIAGAGAVGAHRRSMLQDLEKGQPMEIPALVDAVRELGRITGVATPTIDIVAAAARLRAREAGCLP